MQSLLYARDVRVNDYISVHVPTVREILEDEDRYFGTVSLVVSTPYDMMVQLDDIGIDFTQINEWQLFCMMFGSLKEHDTSLLFGDLDLGKFKLAINEKTNEQVLLDGETGHIIDRLVHDSIARTVRTILQLEKNDKQPGNEEARKFMIERARKKMKRAAKRGKKSSGIEDLIISLVNTSEFPYNYESVLDITIYQFYASLHQVCKRVSFDKTMIGCYAGTVKASELSPDERTWLKTK